MARRAARETHQIGELAARGGVTPDTLRYDERLGLLSDTASRRSDPDCPVIEMLRAKRS